MTYKLEFHIDALAGWNDLDAPLRERFKAKLKERLETPHVPKDKLSGSKNRYKIKFKKPAFRLVYEVFEDRVVVAVIAVGKRERSKVYNVARTRVYVPK